LLEVEKDGSSFDSESELETLQGFGSRIKASVQNARDGVFNGEEVGLEAGEMSEVAPVS